MVDVFMITQGLRTVQEALTEASDALTRQGLKRELEPINES